MYVERYNLNYIRTSIEFISYYNLRRLYMNKKMFILALCIAFTSAGSSLIAYKVKKLKESSIIHLEKILSLEKRVGSLNAQLHIYLSEKDIIEPRPIVD